MKISKIIAQYYKVRFPVSIKGRTHPWLVQLGTTSRNGQGTKNDQIIFLGLFVKCFHNYIFFFHVHKLHALIYGLKFIWEFFNFLIFKVLYS
jgi:hypothetical protein